jgi:hypothetical protein
MTPTLLTKLPSDVVLTIINDWLYDIRLIASLDVAYCSHAERSELLNLIADPRIRFNLLDGVAETILKKIDNTKQSELLTWLSIRSVYISRDVVLTVPLCGYKDPKHVALWKFPHVATIELTDTAQAWDMDRYKADTYVKALRASFPSLRSVRLNGSCCLSMNMACDLLINIITQWPAIADVHLGSIGYKRTAEGCELVLRGSSTWPANFATLLAACPAPIRKLSADYVVPCPSIMHLIEERLSSDLHHLLLPLFDGYQQIDFPALPRVLSKCVQLRLLYLHNAKHMSDDHLATLVIPSKHMNELGIDWALYISDGAMMAFLAQLRDRGAQLEGLSLRGCKMLTGATLSHIAMLFPRIKRVDMWRTGVTEAMVRKMRQEEGLLKGADVQCGW